MPKQAPHKSIINFLPTLCLCAIALLLALPIIIEVGRSISGISLSLPNTGILIARLSLLLRSVAIASLIAMLGITLGIPLAIMLNAAQSRRAQFFAAMLIVPAWMPAFLLYAAGNLLRAPDTALGHALIAYSTASPDRRWMTIWAGYLIAIISLALWLAPIAGVLIASGLGVRSRLYQDMIALEPVGLLGRSWLWIQINRTILIRTWLLTTIFMLGSAVPMHLAGIETYSIVLWRQLAESSPSQWGSVWMQAWPMVLIAIAGAWLITHQLIARETQSTSIDAGRDLPRIPKTIFALSLGVWFLGALLPLLAMLITLDDWGSIAYFWKSQRRAMIDSGGIALFSGAGAVVVAMLCAMVLSHPNRTTRRFGAFSVLTLCVLGLMPGILIGAAIARSSLPWLPGGGLVSGWLGAMIASCTRAVFIGAIIGAICAASESQERRSIRWQLAGPSTLGWIRATLPSIYRPILGSGVIAGLYALYEIEASIMVRPPGMENLPQQLLSDLHYARIEQLSSAGVNLLIIGIVCSLAGSLLLMGIKQTARFSNESDF